MLSKARRDTVRRPLHGAELDPGQKNDDLDQAPQRLRPIARRTSEVVSHAGFFAFCVALVVVWLPTFPVVRSFDTWQLLINTPTTILTFLLVAVLQNSQHRSERGLHAKLDAPVGRARRPDGAFPASEADQEEDLRRDVADLKRAVGLGE